MKLNRDNFEFLKKLTKLGLPIVFQHLLYSLLNLVDSFMIGQLGESNIAAIGIANQVFYLYMIILVSIGTGGAIFTAQYWGAKNIKGLKKILGLCLSIALVIGVGFTSVVTLTPFKVISLFSSDSVVQELGLSYLFIVGFSYLPTGISVVFSQLLKSTERVKAPLIISLFSIGCNVILNYLLIFGKFGFPSLGITGAAIATLTSRVLEMVLILAYTYISRSPFNARFQELFTFDKKLFIKYIKTSIPLTLSQTGWMLATITYNYVYSHMGTLAYAAISIYFSIEYLSFVIFQGISDATAIMIGNLIGEGKIDMVKRYAKKLLVLILIIGCISCVIIYLFAGKIILLYNITPTAFGYAFNLVRIFSFVCIIKAFNQLMINGLFISGGDTKFAFFVDVVVIWVIGVPLAFIGWKVLKLPIYFVYLLVNSEEIVRFSISIKHLFSWSWIKSVIGEDKKKAV